MGGSWRIDASRWSCADAAGRDSCDVTDHPDITIPADLLPARRTLRLRARPRSAPKRSTPSPRWRPTTSAPATARRTVRFVVERAAQRSGRAVRPARRLRDHARQRRHDGVLGRRHVRAHRTAQPAPELRRVLVEVRRRRSPAAPHLDDPEVIESAARHPPRRRSPSADVDVYCLTHNETSTGVAMPLRRPDGVAARRALVLVDATSAAGGLRFDPTQVDVYYFAPQKCLASDGGLWLAAVSPAAIERIERIAASDRWIPAFARPGDRPRQLPQGPDLQHAGAGHDLPRRPAGRLDQRQRRARVGGVAVRPVGRDPLRLGRGIELRHAVRRRPGAAQPRRRPPSTSTTSIDATTVSAVLRANGIVDTESYRKLGRNQLRIAMFPAIDPDDVAALTAASTTSSSACADPVWRRPGRSDAVAVAIAGRRHRGTSMPTMAEVRATADRPGGPVRGRDRAVVDGVEMKVYKDRLPSLRAVAELGHRPGDDDRSSSTATGARLRDFFSRPTYATSQGLRALRRRPRRPGGGAAPNNPEWCLSFWAHGRTSAAILVGLNGWWKTDEILYGLQDSGAKVLVADAKRFERIADQLDELPRPRGSLPRRRRPGRLRGDARLHRFDELLGRAAERRSPTRRSTRTTTRSSSTRAARPAGPRAPSRTHRNMIANLQNTMYNGDGRRSMVGARDAPPHGAGGQTVGAAHLTAVPRVGLPLEPRGRAPRRREAGHPRGQVRARQGAASSSRTKASPSGPRCPTMVWRVCEYPDRHDYDTSHGDRVAFGGSPVGRRAAAQGPRDVPERHEHDATPTASPSPARSPRSSPARTRSTSPTRSAHRCRSSSSHRRRGRQRGPDGADRRGADQGPDHHAGLLGQARGHRRDRRSTAGCTPATSATSTTTASSSSPTGPRT